jgi:hypothetical protein
MRSNGSRPISTDIGDCGQIVEEIVEESRASQLKAPPTARILEIRGSEKAPAGEKREHK